MDISGFAVYQARMTAAVPGSGGAQASLRGFTSGDFAVGAENLFFNCVGARAGDSVLIVGETGPHAFFDENVCHAAAAAAADLGMKPEVQIIRHALGPARAPDAVSAAMTRTDHTVFFSRLGDQLRFQPLLSGGSKTMCYARDSGYLAGGFGRIPHGLFADVLAMLNADLAKVRRFAVTAENGTHLEGALRGGNGSAAAAGFSVNLFPELIFPPLPCADMSGRFALGPWLVSSSTDLYENSLLMLDEPLTAVIENGRITAFEGSAAVAGRARAHLKTLAGDEESAFVLNSWHAGIYPPTYYEGNPLGNIESWADIAFGSPRYTHFHGCGPAPGLVSYSLFDATVAFDGVEYWSNGKFVFLDRPDVRVLLDKYGCAADAFEISAHGIGI